MCPTSEVRPDLVAPPPDGLLVPLDRPPDRHLGRPLQFAEQSADVVLVLAAAELLCDHLSDPPTGPDPAPEPVRLRTVPEELRDHALLGWGELGRATRRGARPQGFGTTVAGTHEPTANGVLGDSQGRGDVPLKPALLLELQGSKPPPLAPTTRGKVQGLHTPF